MHAFGLLVLYGNLAVALQPPALAAAGLGLPRPRWMLDAFLLTGMFSSYSDHNSDLYIAGQPTRSEPHSDRGRFIRLPLHEHFPQRVGIVWTELNATHHRDAHGPAAQRRAWSELAGRIRARHNRLHPERPIDRVRFGVIEWPQDPRGYRAAKRAPAVRAKTWYIDPPSDATKP